MKNVYLLLGCAFSAYVAIHLMVMTRVQTTPQLIAVSVFALLAVALALPARVADAGKAIGTLAGAVKDARGAREE